MQSLRELYRIGCGPSSSHTMGPQRAADAFRVRCPEAQAFRVTLYGSLAATGSGHSTDTALRNAFAPHRLELVWKPEIVLPFHPNGMDFEALNSNGDVLMSWRVFSVGGGALREENVPAPQSIYPFSKMADILKWCDENSEPLWRYVERTETESIWPYLSEVWDAMQKAIARGLAAEGVMPGGLKLRRKAREVFLKASGAAMARSTGLISAYALAVMEENGSTGVVVTAPTCGACGTVPAVVKYMSDAAHSAPGEILKALAIAG